MVVLFGIRVLLMEKPFTDSYRTPQENLSQIFTDHKIKTLNVFERCDDREVKDPKKRVLGKDSTQVGFSVEKDLIDRIDQLARRDCISRSTWMREALITAWREAREFKRTPIHGYLATPIDITPARVAEEPDQTAKRRSKTECPVLHTAST